MGKRAQWASIVSVIAAGVLAYACGSDVADDANASADGGAGGDGQVGASPNDTCNGAACANHSGPKDFVEPGTPPEAPGLFGSGAAQPSGTDPSREPAVVYPNHETMFPVNVSHIRHEWVAGGTNDVFRLRFEGPKTVVTIYTNKKDWEPTDEQWDWIAESNRGGEVKLTVSGLTLATPAQVWQSRAYSLFYSAAEVEGAIYYWSTGTKGVMRALVSDKIPEKFYTDPKAADADTCVACHTLSRDGKRLAVGYDGENLREVSVPARATIIGGTPGGGGKKDAGAGTARPSAWTTFSPDGKMLLVAANGTLTLVDSDTGAPVGPNNGVVPIPAGKVATNPDWSALGDKVVIALGTKGGNKEIEGGEIAILPYAGGAWGAPTIIVPAAGGVDNNFFPVFSPDSKWIAYVNAQGKSKDALSAALKLVPTAGGSPVTLTRLNGRVNNADGVANTGNSMPTWAPSTKPGVFWLAFSSVRAYGTVRPPDTKEDQIWIAAIDPTKPDPGYAGFWAPFQSLDAGNHRAFWTHTEGEKQCKCVEICGDGIDNDCDGVADEADCQTCLPREICGNGKDDDCNCAVDDCNVEICNDGIDNDGDGLVDGLDPSCAVK